MRLVSFLRRRDERGVAMIVVVMLVVVCFTVVTVVASSSVFGTSQTADDRSRVQALSAAEAGRDFALSQAPCVGDTAPTYTQASGGVPAGAPTFATKYYWVEGQTPPSAAPDATGCPPETDPNSGYIGIESTGTAPGNGSSVPVKKTVLAWYPYTPGNTVDVAGTITVTSTVTSSAPAGSGGIAGAIVQGGTGTADLQGMQESGGDVVYDVTGASSLKCNNADIGGNLILWNKTNASVDVPCNNKSSVGGTLYASGDVTIDNMTVGNVVSVHGSVKVGQQATVTGDVWAKGADITGVDDSQQHDVSDYGSLPAVFSDGSHLWTDYSKANVPPKDSAEYQVQTVTDCSGNWLQGFAASATQSTIVDATGCGKVDLQNLYLSLTQDMTVLLPSDANFHQGHVSLEPGHTDVEFNLIVPDDVADDAPTCSKAGTLKIGKFDMDAGITGLAYAPCTMAAGKEGERWQGQLYAGAYDGFSASDLLITFAKVTRVPGAMNDDGFGPTTTTTETSTKTETVPTTVPSDVPPSMDPTLIRQTEP